MCCQTICRSCWYFFQANGAINTVAKNHRKKDSITGGMVVAAVLAIIKLPDQIMAAAMAKPIPIIEFLFIGDAIKLFGNEADCNLQLIFNFSRRNPKK